MCASWDVVKFNSLPVCMYKSIKTQAISPAACEILYMNTRVPRKRKIKHILNLFSPVTFFLVANKSVIFMSHSSFNIK